MGHEERIGAASLHGLARVQRERHWTTIMDVALAFAVLLWVAGVTVGGFVPDIVVNALPVLIGLMVVHRLLVLLERLFSQPTQARPLDEALSLSGPASGPVSGSSRAA